MSEPAPPSGEQVELAFGDQRAVVVESGGGLRTYSAGDREILDGYAVGEMASGGRGQVLMPWPNRLEDGSYEFEGRSHQLALTEVAAHNAIHGLVRWVAWKVGERDPARVVMEHRLRPQPGYPFSLALSIEYSLSEGGLRVRTTATNVGQEPCPFGGGAHPYLRPGASIDDRALLQVPAQTVLRADGRGLPVGRSAVAGTEFDFRQPRVVGTLRLDHAFTDLGRDADGRARIELHDPDGDGVTLWMDGSYRYVMIFTGDPLPSVARHSVAVEPMTCPPNAFRSGEALVRLEPGESFAGEWGIRRKSASAAP